MTSAVAPTGIKGFFNELGIDTDDIMGSLTKMFNGLSSGSQATIKNLTGFDIGENGGKIVAGLLTLAAGGLLAKGAFGVGASALSKDLIGTVGNVAGLALTAGIAAAVFKFIQTGGDFGKTFDSIKNTLGLGSS